MAPVMNCEQAQMDVLLLFYWWYRTDGPQRKIVFVARVTLIAIAWRKMRRGAGISPAPLGGVKSVLTS